MLDKPNIFNIPANYHFFESLFDWMEKNFSDQISEVKIFLPNQRSCREFRELFLKKKLNAILPQIKAISDISYDDFFSFLPAKEAKETIDEIMQIEVLDGIDYLFFLSKEIQKLSIFGEVNFDQAFKIAIHLKNLFDEIEREEVDLKKLEEIDDSDLAKHRQLTLDFLKNFHIQIKNSLLKKNILFSSSSQNFIIQKFVSLLEEHGSKTPIIIAGSTGSVSFGKKLIKAISRQKNGYVLLHGLSENEKDFEEESHPQFFLNQLIKFLEIEKNQIKKIADEKFCLSDESRQQLISLMMLPSFESIKWQKAGDFLNIKKTSDDLQNNFHLLETKNEIEEAKIISLILAENLKQKKTAALITNNDKLATLVKSELQIFSYPFNDTRNLGIFNSKLINFLLLILELKENDFDSHTLLSLIKNPLCAYSKEKEILANFEIAILRQDRSKLGRDGIEQRLKSLNDKNLSDFFERFCADLTIDSQLAFEPESLASQTSLIISLAENLGKKSWQKLLEEEPAQIEIFEFFEKLKKQNNLTTSWQNLSSTFKTLLAQISYFEKSDASAPIQILSSLEARLLNYDLMIIASLNEGDFPTIEPENWLGKKIKKDLEIDRSLKKIGQNAYDFCNYLSNQSVVLSRCKSSNGALKIESPFLLKFKTLCKKIKIEPNLGEKYFAELKTLNSCKIRQIKAPNPKPKIEFRPKKISVTEISKLLSDPYSIYAKKILQLKELEKIDFEPSYSEFGSFVHKALEEFVKNPNQKDFLKNSHKIFEKYFTSQDSKLTWLPKFENIFADFVKKNEQLSDLKNYLETPVKLQLSDILISGKIDRIILNEENNLEIFDYKTGQLPSTKDVICGIEPQLTLAALMLVEGMIESELENADLEKITSLNYWKLSASKEGEIKKICKENEEIKILIAAAKAGLAKLFEYFVNEENGYIAIASDKKNEYKHLIRASEWNK